MSVQELENEVRQLCPAELKQFRHWFEQFQEEEWDRQIAEDSQAGRLNSLIEEAKRERAAGNCKPL